jgi:hypothetical protein
MPATATASRKTRLKDPQGGLTAAGRKHYARTEGAHLKPGVKGPADTPEKMKRKGSFLRRHFANLRGPLVGDDGKPTRLALSARAWGEPAPKTEAAAKRLAEKGARLLTACAGTARRGTSAGCPIRCSTWSAGTSWARRRPSSKPVTARLWMRTTLLPESRNRQILLATTNVGNILRAVESPHSSLDSRITAMPDANAKTHETHGEWTLSFFAEPSDGNHHIFVVEIIRHSRTRSRHTLSGADLGADRAVDRLRAMALEWIEEFEGRPSTNFGEF